MTSTVVRRDLPSLTGLRFVAALAVFWRHADALFAGTRLERLGRHLFFQGTIGVSFFFVLSGFVLTWSRREHDTPLAFYRRRFARIYPNHAVTWVLGGAVALWIGSTVTVGIALTTLVLLQAWVPNQDYFVGMNGVSWSLSCEAFFYALFPLLAVVAVRIPRAARLALLCGCAAGTIAMPWIARDAWPAQGLWLVYIFPPVRLLEFLAGVLLACEVRTGKWPRIPASVGAAFAIAAYVAAGEAGLWRPGLLPVWAGYAAFTIVPIVLLIGSVAQADILGRGTIFAWRPLVVLGEWSYAFYLLHLLVLFAFLQLTSHRFLGSEGAIGASLGLLAVSVAAAAALHAAVERPFERRFRGAPVRPPAARAPF